MGLAAASSGQQRAVLRRQVLEPAHHGREVEVAHAKVERGARVVRVCGFDPDRPADVQERRWHMLLVFGDGGPGRREVVCWGQGVAVDLGPEFRGDGGEEAGFGTVSWRDMVEVAFVRDAVLLMGCQE